MVLEEATKWRSNVSQQNKMIKIFDLNINYLNIMFVIVINV